MKAYEIKIEGSKPNTNLFHEQSSMKSSHPENWSFYHTGIRQSDLCRSETTFNPKAEKS